MEKITRFKTPKYFCTVSQNGLAFLGQIVKASLSEVPRSIDNHSDSFVQMDPYKMESFLENVEVNPRDNI